MTVKYIYDFDGSCIEEKEIIMNPMFNAFLYSVEFYLYKTIEKWYERILGEKCKELKNLCFKEPKQMYEYKNKLMMFAIDTYLEHINSSNTEEGCQKQSFTITSEIK